MKRMMIICAILLAATLAFAIDKEVQDFLDVIDDVEALAEMVPNATTASQQAKILESFDKLMQKMQDVTAAMEVKYADLGEDEVPEGLENAEDLGDRFGMAFLTIYGVGADNMEDPEVAAAYEKIDARLEAIMGSEDSW